VGGECTTTDTVTENKWITLSVSRELHQFLLEHLLTELYQTKQAFFVAQNQIDSMRKNFKELGVDYDKDNWANEFFALKTKLANLKQI
jgi:hypothetical protein